MELSVGTKKMLEGLGMGDATITDLAQYISKSGVFVTLHIKRCRGAIALPPKAVGVRVDRMSDEAKQAYKDIVRLGNLTFVPKEDENELTCIEATLRRKLYDCSTTDGFMPTELFDAFKADFVDLKTKYMAQRDIIAGKWDALVEDFSQQVQKMLAGIRMLQRDRVKLHKRIMGSLPTKERYLSSFEVSMSVKAYPSVSLSNTALPESVREAVQDSWAETTVALAEQSILTLLVDVFDATNEAVRAYMKTGSVHGRRITALVRLGGRLKRMNVFANPVVAETAELLEKLPNQDPTAAEAQLEACIINIYRYADSVGFELSLDNCVFDESALIAAA